MPEPLPAGLRSHLLKPGSYDQGRQRRDHGRYVTGENRPGRKPGGDPGDRRIGVVWHTQGSGKSLTMAIYSGAVIWEPAMENPTVVVLTRDEVDGLMAGLLTSEEQPNGTTRLGDWLAKNGDGLGRGYVSELRRNFRL